MALSTAQTKPKAHLADCVFTVSAQTKLPDVPIFSFLRRQFGDIPMGNIGSVFGFVEPTTLYGGRKFAGRELSEQDVAQLNHAEIGIRIPLSNHNASEQEYEQAKPLLEKYHFALNSVSVTNDDLAKWIRADFPKYRLDASVIKNIDCLKKLAEALAIYDEVVLPMNSNEDLDFLKSIEEKDRITLFANASCAFTCPEKACYMTVSKMNKGDTDKTFQCPRAIKEHHIRGMVNFELQPLIEMGFNSFKLLRPAPGMQMDF